MGLTVKQVSSKSELKQFVKFPFELYKGNEQWVPPLVRDEMTVLDEQKNPSMEDCDVAYWLVYNGEKIQGRIAGIIHNWELIGLEKKARFGWLDFVDDLEVSALLFDTFEKWALDKGCNIVHGPLGFTDMDFEGMLVEGFEETATIATIYNYPYYNDHMLSMRFEKSTDWVEVESEVPKEGLRKLERTASLVAKRFNLRTVSFKNNRSIKAYGHKIFDTLNRSYSVLYGFHPLSKKEMDNYLGQYFSFLIPGFISVVVDPSNNVVAFGITMPSLSEAFKKANGKLFPFGFIHILRALKKSKIADLYLVGVLPEYQKMGVTAMVMDEVYQTYRKRGIERVYTNPVLESNKGLLNHMSDFQGLTKIRKKRRCYVKSI